MPSSCCCAVSSSPHVLIAALLSHVIDIVPSSTCVSARWVGKKGGQGCLPWYSKIKNDNEWWIWVIVHCLVAMSLTVTWHLDSVLDMWVGGAGELAHLGLLLPVSVWGAGVDCVHFRAFIGCFSLWAVISFFDWLWWWGGWQWLLALGVVSWSLLAASLGCRAGGCGRQLGQNERGNG